MSLANLLNESCVHQRRSVVTSGKTDTESWATVATLPCRMLTRSAVRGNVDKAQHATLLTTRFMLPVSSTVVIRDRLVCAGVVYPVIKVITPVTPRGASHKVAVCEAVAGSV